MRNNVLESDNIINELNLILLNKPEDLSVIEQVRWLYIKVGQLFSYDYRIAYNPEYADNQIDFSKDYISRYQTCVQISYLLNIMLDDIEGCKSRVIQRDANTRGISEVNHVANEVTLKTGEKFILDLTLDLYLIQSGCQTKQFGFSGDLYNDYDIISLNECRKIDEKLGLIKGNEYTDEEINKIKNELSKTDYSNMTDEEQIKYKIGKIIPLIPIFNGYHEGKQFINKLFKELLNYDYKEYNLTNSKIDEDIEMVTCFNIINNSSSLWYIYDQKLGIISTNEKNLKQMLDLGWKTKSETLLDGIYGLKY